MNMRCYSTLWNHDTKVMVNNSTENGENNYNRKTVNCDYQLYKTNNYLSLQIIEHTQKQNKQPKTFFLNNKKIKQNFKLFGFPIFRFWAYLTKVISETRRGH